MQYRLSLCHIVLHALQLLLCELLRLRLLLVCQRRGRRHHVHGRWLLLLLRRIRCWLLHWVWVLLWRHVLLLLLWDRHTEVAALLVVNVLAVLIARHARLLL